MGEVYVDFIFVPSMVNRIPCMHFSPVGKFSVIVGLYSYTVCSVSLWAAVEIRYTFGDIIEC